MADQIFPEGIRVFNKHPKQPDFVIGSLVVTPNDLITWLKKNEALLSEYEGKKQLRLQILDGKKGLYLSVDTYKKNSKEEESSLPF